VSGDPRNGRKSRRGRDGIRFGRRQYRGGATKPEILRLVLGAGLRLALAGAAAGIVAALGVTRLIATRLYGVRPRDPATFITLCLLLTAAALIAAKVPARRATKVDPIIALRHE
jgi:putative ABC transport system permease protein